MSDEKSSRPWLCIDNWLVRRPARRSITDPTIHRLSGSCPRPFLFGKATIGRNEHGADEEWASEGAYGGDVDENGWFFFSKTREWDVSGT